MPDLSERGRSLIKSFEGLRLKAYQDSVGVWTIGYGHTGPAARAGRDITYAEADTLFDGDVGRFTKGVLESIQVAVTQAQLDALISFAFNVGLGAFRKSTMVAYINRNDFTNAAKEFARWIYGDVTKPPLPGLVRRRELEMALFAGAESPREAVRDALAANLSHVAQGHEAAGE